MNVGFKCEYFTVFVFIFNNDFFRDYYGFIPWYGEVCYESYPRLTVYFSPKCREAYSFVEEFSGRSVDVRVFNLNGRVIYEGSCRLEKCVNPLLPSILVGRIRLDEKIANASYADVELGEFKWSVKIPNLVRVYGRITDFNGRPRRAYVMFANPYGFPGGTAIVKTGDDGFYEMLVPEALYHHVFICDGNYGRKTLEFYGWHVAVKPPEFRLDARFDKIEVYRLTVAETPERTLLIEFVPMDIFHTVRGAERIYREKGRFDLSDLSREDLWPKFSLGEIEVYLDDQRLELRSLSHRLHSLIDHGAEGFRPSHLVEAKIPESLPPGVYDLKIVLCKDCGGFKEYGEAVYFSLELWC